MLITWYYWLAIAAAVVVVAPFLWKSIRQTIRCLSAFIHFVDITPTLIEVGNQFQSNGGSSLRDAIDRIEKNQEADHDIVVAHIAADAAFQARVEPYIAGR